MPTTQFTTQLTQHLYIHFILTKQSQFLHTNDPLIGHVACSTLITLLRRAASSPMSMDQEEIESCLHHAVTNMHAGQPISVLHVVDLFHRLISLSSRGDGRGNSHPELINEDDPTQEHEGSAIAASESSHSLALLSLKVMIEHTCVSLSR